MSAMSSDRPVQLVESTPAADPAPLGLAGFALTTFLLSGHNASFIPDLIWVGPAIFYGGMAQFAAGMWEFRNRNVFGATAFSTYGGFWMGLGLFITLGTLSKNWFAAYTDPHAVFERARVVPVRVRRVQHYMLIASMRVNAAVFMVFFMLEITEILLVIGFLGRHHGARGTTTSCSMPVDGRASSRLRSRGTPRRRAS